MRGSRLKTNDIGIFVRELPTQVGKLLVQPQKLRLWRVRRNGNNRRRCAGGSQLLFQSVAPLHGPKLLILIHPKLGVEPFEAEHVRLDLLRQLAHVLQLEVASAPLLLVELSFDVGELRFQECGGA